MPEQFTPISSQPSPDNGPRGDSQPKVPPPCSPDAGTGLTTVAPVDQLLAACHAFLQALKTRDAVVPRMKAWERMEEAAAMACAPDELVQAVVYPPMPWASMIYLTDAKHVATLRWAASKLIAWCRQRQEQGAASGGRAASA